MAEGEVTGEPGATEFFAQAWRPALRGRGGAGYYGFGGFRGTTESLQEGVAGKLLAKPLDQL